MSAKSNPRSKLPQKILAAIGLGLVSFVVIFLIINFAVSLLSTGKIMAGVSMNGVDLSGQTIEEAAISISRAYNYPDSGSILLVDGDKSWSLKPAQLGFYLDYQASAQAAYEAGRTGPLLSVLVQRFDLLNGTVSAQPSFIFDEKTASAFLTSLAQEINQPVREASISISGTEVLVNNGQVGRVLDIQSTLAAITQQIQSMTDGIVPLVVVEAAPIILNVDTQADLARSVLSEPLSLILPPDSNGQSVSIQIAPADLAPLLAFEKVTAADGSQYQIKANSVLLRAYLNTVKESTDLEPKDARFIFNDDTKQLELEKSAVVGRYMDVEKSLAAINDALQKGEHNTELVFDLTNPQVTDQMTGSDLGITEMVYSYTSYFRGSSDERLHNIKTASAAFHGLLVPPGATLSMSDQLGNISLDNGYAEALIIWGDTSIKGVGGGVCQVSTTLFRTAFYSGYQIQERSPHTYRVYYYEQTASGHDGDLAGLDATVFVPLVDFKFTNDTPYWLLMETYVSSSNYSLTWKFYSTKDGRTVDYSSTGLTNVIETPEPSYRENPELPKGTIKQVDWAVKGADVTIHRKVYKNGEVLHDDSFFTRYVAWPDIFEYGPGTEIPTPTPAP